MKFLGRKFRAGSAKILGTTIVANIIFSAASAAAAKTYRVQEVTHSGPGPVFSESKIQIQMQPFANLSQDRYLLKDLPEHLVEHSPKSSPSQFREWLVREEALTPRERRALQELAKLTPPPIVDAEVRTLVNQGPSENRIDLTFVGDGYQLADKEKFFADVQAMTDDLFTGQTFASYISLFNVHAVFLPSQDSGITDVERKNTALGLYRNPVGSKRAIMPGNTAAIERALRLAPDADYPILLANDDYYGGLGGRYAITTRAAITGPMVLRHELGHNFGNVGEEYDGGSVYSGANSSRSSQTSWPQWLSAGARAFEGQFLSGSYVWQNLKGRPFTSEFTVPSGFAFVDIVISTVGWATPHDVKVTYDGQVQTFREGYTADRSFFDVVNPATAPGRHKMQIEDQGVDSDNVVAFVRAVAHKSDIITRSDHTAAYPTYDSAGSMAGFRPTYAGCLMREMRIKSFCSVDQENMWMQFLNIVTLIDDIEKVQVEGETLLKAKTPSLALSYSWKDVATGSVLGTNSELVVPAGLLGDVELEVVLAHSEIRKTSARLKTKRRISVN